MKIFIFTNIFPENNYIGGAEIQALILAKNLSKKGHRVNYLSWYGKEGLPGKKVENFIANYLTTDNKKNLVALKNFNKFCKQEKPDICYIRNFKYLFFLYLICRLNKIPVVYNTTHIENCAPFSEKIKLSINFKTTITSIKAAILHYLNFKTLKKVNLITINKFQAEMLKNKYKINATPIYNSMEDFYEQNKPAQKENAVVWVANIKTRKRPEIFIKLAGELKNYNYKFLMIGFIQNNIEGYKKLISEEENNNPNFKYLGGMADYRDVDKVLAKSKILIHTCIPEGFGNNFIQAWFNECPCVTLSFDADDIMTTNKIGFHSKTYENLLKDVRFLIENDNIRADMGKRARQFALINHSPENNIIKYENYFMNIIKKIQ